MLRNHIANDSIRQIIPRTNVTEHDPDDVREWARNCGKHISECAVGAKVIMTKNFSPTIANGSIGIVTCLEYDNDVLTAICVKFDHHADAVVVKPCDTDFKYRPGRTFYRVNFPLLLSYAMTVHRAQGATIAHRVLIHIREGFAAGLAYVAFSRVSKEDMLRVVDTTIASENFRPMPIPKCS